MGSDQPCNLGLRKAIVRLKLVDGTRINGQVNLNRHPAYDRLSDLVCDPDVPFIVLFNATLYDPSTDRPAGRNVLFVNKTHILWVEPEDEQN